MKIASFLFVFAFGMALVSCNSKASEKTGILDSTTSHNAAANVQVQQLWTLPGELNEISANVLADESRMACVQDNLGTIYLYNLRTKAVEDKISFAGNGDFEGLELVGKTYYALRSDGVLFEIVPAAGKPSVKTYDLPLQTANDCETLFYDAASNRLLIGVKEKDLASSDKKGVYAFDLATKQFNSTPVFSIDAKDEGASGKKKGKKGKGEIKPSDMAINPSTKEVYILNGPKSELLVADKSGSIKSVTQLDKSIFPQPEGICFSPSGELYISSEGGKKGAAVIAKVSL